VEPILSTRRVWAAFAAAGAASLLVTAFSGTVTIFQLLRGWCAEGQAAAGCSAQQHHAGVAAAGYAAVLAAISIVVVAGVTHVGLGGSRSPVRRGRVVVLATMMVLASPCTTAVAAALLRAVAPQPFAPLLLLGLGFDAALLVAWQVLVRAAAGAPA
jgi:hypothetical protein